ncbi:MAG: AEC family transporter [Octadecabacter sp.]
MTNILGPIFVITAIGYLLGRSSIQLETQTLSSLVILVATPALIFSSLTSLHVSLEILGSMAGAAMLSLTTCGVLAAIALRLAGGSISSFLPPLTFPNSGNVGIPLVILTFGDQGALLGVAYFFVVALAQHSVGFSIYAGSVQLSTFLRQPLFYSIIAVLLVTWFSIPVPQLVLTTTEMLGGMMVPAMLLLLGLSLSSMRVSDLGPALMTAVGRLVIGCLAAIVVIVLLDLRGVPAGVVFLMSTMPAAIVNYIFAERFQRNPEQVAGMVVVSTVMTFICLPALVWSALAISKMETPFASFLTRSALDV